jgi:alpha-methylacyl-CoA racemase
MRALQGLRVLEFAGLAPGPMAGLILRDYGADVIRVDRTGKTEFETDWLSRYVHDHDSTGQD